MLQSHLLTSPLFQLKLMEWTQKAYILGQLNQQYLCQEIGPPLGQLKVLVLIQPSVMCTKHPTYGLPSDWMRSPSVRLCLIIPHLSAHDGWKKCSTQNCISYFHLIKKGFTFYIAGQGQAPTPVVTVPSKQLLLRYLGSIFHLLHSAPNSLLQLFHQEFFLP